MILPVSTIRCDKICDNSAYKTLSDGLIDLRLLGVYTIWIKSSKLVSLHGTATVLRIPQ